MIQRLVRIKGLRFITLILLFVFGIFLISIKAAHAQGCAISEFTMSPSGPYTLGTHVQLHVKSNCGTVRFEINGQPKAEIGSSEQWETWKTEEFGTGNHEVCAVARGDGGWENANRQCRTVYVEGSQAPPSGSTQGENVRCWVNSFVVTPGSGPVGTRFNLASQGQCDGNMRAARYTIDGKPFGEHSTNTHNTDWNSSGYSTGRHSICFLVTAGDWDEAAQSCVSINLKADGSPSTDVTEGEPSDNGNPGQTEDSDPSNPAAGGNTGSQCAGSAISLSIGDSAKVLPGPSNRLRRNHSIGSSQIGNIPGNARFIVTGGPACQDGYWWWEVSYQGQTGWTAQGDGTELWIQELDSSNAPDQNPPLPTATPRPLLSTPLPTAPPQVVTTPVTTEPGHICSNGGCVLVQAGSSNRLYPTKIQRGLCPGQDELADLLTAGDWKITFSLDDASWRNYSVTDVRYWGEWYTGIQATWNKPSAAIISISKSEITICAGSLLLFPSQTWLWLANQ